MGGREALEASIYSHLYAFYGRYYQDGDFVSKRRYSKRERYAIPYNGEEVCLYWANHDQYYVKTGEHCTDYTFSAPGGVTVRFHADEETRASAVDIPETFNYLIGLHVQTRRVYDDDGQRYLVYWVVTREERRVAVIWCEADGWEQADYERDRDCVAEEALAVGADEVYVNGDSLVPGARPRADSQGAHVRAGGGEAPTETSSRAGPSPIPLCPQRRCVIIEMRFEMAAKIRVPRQAIAAFCRSNRIRRLAFFGSVLRDDFGPGSDVDVLVEFEPEARVGLIGFAGIENELSRLIGRKVDLNTPGFLSPYFRDDVLRHAENVYEQAW